MSTRPAARNNPCQCFAIVDEARSNDSRILCVSCGQTTRHEFAVGHDAKLKSVLIRCVVENKEYVVDDGEMTIGHDPWVVAAQRGWTHFLERAVEIRNEKAQKRADREHAKQRRRAAKLAQPGRYITAELTSRYGSAAAMDDAPGVVVISAGDTYTVAFDDVEDAVAAVDHAKNVAWARYVDDGGDVDNRRSFGGQFAAIKRAIRAAAA